MLGNSAENGKARLVLGAPAWRNPGIPSGASRADPTSAHNTKSKFIPIFWSKKKNEELKVAFKGTVTGVLEAKWVEMLKSLSVNFLTC